MIRTPMAVLVTLAAAPLTAFAVACGGAAGGAVGDSKLPSGSAAAALDHEQCSEAGNRVELLDTNNDGKPDIRRIFSKASGREICRIVDLSHDRGADSALFVVSAADGIDGTTRILWTSVQPLICHVPSS